MNIKAIDSEKGLAIYYQNGIPRQLGAGANGKVFFGAVNYGKPNEQQAAVKQIPRPPYEYWQKKLKDEYLIHQSIEHPNIVKYYDFYEDKNNYYIFLELCDGKPLSTLIQLPQSSYSSRTKKLSQIQANNYVIPIIDALYYLSNVIIQPQKTESKGLTETWQGVSHRDIKPENIMIVNDVPKLIDFGLVKQQNPDVDPTLHRGTPYYMSPQNLGNQTYNPEKNDIWSMGVMWYQLLHGYFPWKREVKTEMELIFQHKEMTITFEAGISSDVQEVIRAMLIYTEEDRPSWKEIIKYKVLQKQFEEKEKKTKLLEVSGDNFIVLQNLLKNSQLENSFKNKILQEVLQIQSNLFVKYKQCVLKNTKMESLKTWILEQQMFLMDFSINVTRNFDFELKESLQQLITMSLIDGKNQNLKLIQVISFWICFEDNKNLTIEEILDKIKKL